jgi:SAM-dependent methyltransferase
MWFAWLMRLASRYHEPRVAARKRALFRGLTGTVLEIGPGNGVNLQYLPPGVRWIGYEPNSSLAHDIVVPKGGRLVVAPYVGQLETCDAAICSLVLCSVSSPRLVLEGLFRSLKPGGRLLFVEHVAAEQGSALRASQDRWEPLWKRCAGGCHPNRETVALIEAAGFTINHLERFHLPMWLAGPHVVGEAFKP